VGARQRRADGVEGGASVVAGVVHCRALDLGSIFRISFGRNFRICTTVSVTVIGQI
jgi:hypothetical protein